MPLGSPPCGAQPPSWSSCLSSRFPRSRRAARSTRSTTCSRSGTPAARSRPGSPPPGAPSRRWSPRRGRTAGRARSPSPGSRAGCRPARRTDGLHCNVDLVGHQGTSGGFKVHRYIDPAGHECAFYDTALLFPVNALKLDATSQGVAVLDMSNPRNPVQTATLTEMPMNSPHESLNLNPKRGLLAAVLGNPSTYPGLVSIYDVRKDCRHPVLQSTRPVARLGHESGFSPDGKTFYATGTAFEAITAIDVTDPKNPHAIWQGNVTSHGMSLSPDGNARLPRRPRRRAADPRHQRDPGAQGEPAGARDQPADLEGGLDPPERDPVHRRRQALPAGDRRVHPGHDRRRRHERGRRRADHRHLRRAQAAGRLQPPPPGQPAGRPRGGGSDPGATSPVQGYAAHYCSLSTEVTRPWWRARSSPPACACSTSATCCTRRRSPTTWRRRSRARRTGSWRATSRCPSPRSCPSRREVWYTDGATGFYVLRVAGASGPRTGAGGASARRGRGARLPFAQRADRPAQHRPGPARA